jgi:hypothetical protein
MKEVICPVCGKKGSLHLKTVKNNYGVEYTYYYVAHYDGLEGKTRKVVWHYVGKSPDVRFEESEGEKERS